MIDDVKSPHHYTQNKIQPKSVTKFLNFYLGNSFKYVWRHKYKGGKQDLLKAIQYINFQIDDSPEFHEINYREYDYATMVVDEAGFDDATRVVLKGIVLVALKSVSGQSRENRLRAIEGLILDLIKNEYGDDDGN